MPQRGAETSSIAVPLFSMPRANLANPKVGWVVLNIRKFIMKISGLDGAEGAKLPRAVTATDL